MTQAKYNIRHCPNCQREISIFNKSGNLMAKHQHEKLQSCSDISCVREMRNAQQAAKREEDQRLYALIQSDLKKGMKSIVNGIVYRVGTHGFIYRESKLNDWIKSSIGKAEFCKGVMQ